MDAFEFRISRECGRDQDEWPSRTEAIVAEVSRTLRGEADLLVDANSGFSPARWREMMARMAHYRTARRSSPGSARKINRFAK